MVANVENAAAGFGVTPGLARGFLEAGVDVMTSGNHIWDRKEIIGYIVKENLLLRPANYPAGTPGVGSVVKAGAHQVGVLNLQGRTFMASIDCPFARADEELARPAETLGDRGRHARGGDVGEAGHGLVPRRARLGRGRHPLPRPDRRRAHPAAGHGVPDRPRPTGPFDSVIGVEPELAIQRFRTGCRIDRPGAGRASRAP